MDTPIDLAAAAMDKGIMPEEGVDTDDAEARGDFNAPSNSVVYTWMPCSSMVDEILPAFSHRFIVPRETPTYFAAWLIVKFFLVLKSPIGSKSTDTVYA